MHILWLKSDYIDPPDTGGKIRTYNLLRQLQKLCNITYVSLKDSNRTIDETAPTTWASQVVSFPQFEEIKEGFRFYTTILARMFSAKPYIVQKYRSKNIYRYQQHLGVSGKIPQRWYGKTVLVCDFLEMTGNVDWSKPYPKILFQHNVESVIWRRYFENESNQIKKAYFWFEYQRLKRYESLICNRFNLVLAVSQQDKNVLQRELGVTSPVDVIATGVDVEFFTPVHDVDPVPGRLLFLGSLDWIPNIDGIGWFVRDIYPRIKATAPHVTLDIVGRRPTSEIRSLAGGDPSIRIYASVPDVRPYITAADLFIVPLRVGSGTRLKIFEAMAMKSTVVSTTVGAEGLPVHHGQHLLLADSAEEFANTVVSLLKDPAKKQALSTEGHEFVIANYSWEKVGQHFYDLCLSVCNDKSR